MKQLINLLNTRYPRAVPEETWMNLFSHAKVLTCKKNEYLVTAGDNNSDIFIVKNGIIRTVDMDGNRERTIRFSFPGAMCFARHPFLCNEPSVSHIVSVVASTVLCVPRDYFVDLAEKDHKFALWALYYAWTEQYLEDDRESNIHNGSAEERYIQTVKNRPELAKNVPSAVLATYLGCSPEHLSRIKAKLLFK